MRSRDRGEGIKEWGVSVVLVITIASGLAAAEPESNRAEDELRLTLRVNNYAGLSRETLTGAITQARGVFSKVGIETAWHVCSGNGDPKPPECRAALGLTEIAFNVVPRHKPVKGVFGHTACAAVFEDQRGLGKYGLVYADCLDEMPDVGGLLPSVMLGYLLAHEIGYLLLPGEDHTATGVMRPVLRPEEWQLAMIGHLTFLPDQGERLRAEVKARTDASRA